MVQEKEKRGYIYGVILLLAGIAAFAVRWAGIEYITADFEYCVLPWSEAMKTGQGPSVLLTYDGDYNMPYITVLWLLNYLPGRTIVKVKLFSILFEYLGAVAAGLITAHFAKTERKELWFTAACTAVLFYPPAVLNGAYWGQCDFIYVTFLLYMIWAILKGHYSAAMILLGCALSFKLQAVLILPFLLIFWWKKRNFSGICFLLVPVMMEILCIPAILGGYSVLIPFEVYIRQLGRYPHMYVFYPNFWALFKDARYYIFSSVSILCILAGLGVFAIVIIRKKTEISKRQWFEFAVWSTFFMMCFLPCMHERYGMLVEILAVIYAFLNRKTWWNAVIIGAGSYISYLQTTFGQKILPDQWIAVAYLLSLGFFSWQMIRNWNGEETDKCHKEYFSERKSGISAIEEKTMDFIDRYILVLAVIVLTALAVAARKPMIEYMSSDYLPNLIEIEGNHHTPLYMFVMHILSRLTDGILKRKTLFFLVKMLCVVSDLFAAAMAALCSYDFKSGRSGESAAHDWKLRAVMVYGGMLFLPAVLFNSSLWAHLDSIAIGLLLGACFLYVHGKEIAAGVLAGMACGLLTYYAVWLLVAIVAVTVIRRKKNAEKTEIRRKRQKYFGSSFIIVFLVSSLTGTLCGYNILQSISKFFGAWANPGGGVLYPLLVFVLLMCFYDQRWFPAWLLLELAVVLDWGEFLYGQPVLPHIVYGLLYLSAGICAVPMFWKTLGKLKE